MKLHLTSIRKGNYMNKLKNWLQKLKFRREPKTMDELLYNYGIGSCFRLFPPSFYRKHSEEKAKQLREAELTKLHQMLEEYEKQINLKKSDN